MTTPRETILELLDKLDPYKAGASELARVREAIRAEVLKLDTPVDPETIVPGAAERIERLMEDVRAEHREISERLAALESPRGRKAVGV